MKRIFFVLALTGSLVLLSSGCVTHVFTSPASISTKSAVGKHVTPIKPVSVQRTDCFIILIPIVHDPRTGFDDLLKEAKTAGGDCVVDFRVQSEPSFFWLFPPIVVNKYSYTGTAARMDR